MPIGFYAGNLRLRVIEMREFLFADIGDELLVTRAVEDDNVRNGYELVYTPNITREELFKISGHLPLYEANQYPPMAAGHEEAEDVRYRVKPMNCPMHALIFKSQPRSYRDLPLRLSEVANVYRNEKSGVLHGLLRVRGLSVHV